MSGLQFSPKNLQDLPIKPLGDETLKVDIAEASASYDGKPEAGGVTFSIEASAKASIHAYNSASDVKEEGVIGTAPKKDDDEGLKMPPQIIFDPKFAWLKYKLEAGVKASAEVSFPPVGIEGGGEAKVVFADYHRHAPTEMTTDAVIADVPRLRFAGNADDAFELGDGEALSYQVYGKLSASVTLSWSDTLTAGLSALSGFIKSSELIKLSVSPSLEIAFSVEAEDDYRLVFTKGAGGRVGVAVLKAKSRQIGIKAGLKVGVKFADEAVVEKALNNIYAGVFGSTIAKVEAMLDKLDEVTSLDQLPPAQRTLAELIIARLKLGDEVNKPKELRKHWDDIQKKVTDNFKKAAQTKVELGFTYEYLRLKTDEALLLAELDEQTFRACHGQLMRRDMSGVLAALRKGGGTSKLKFYLRQETLTRRQAWGFTLGIEPFGIKVGGKDKVEKSRVTQRNIEEQQRIAYDGLRRYDAEWNGDKVSWYANYKAEMKEFAASPTTCDFDYGLSLNWVWDEKSLSEGELKKYLDHAALWHVIRPGSVDEALALFKDETGKKAKVSLELKLDNEDLKALLPRVLNPDDIDALGPKGTQTAEQKVDFYGANALAAAMPYHDDHPGRRVLDLRIRLYRPLWRMYFENDSQSASQYAKDASNHILKKGTFVPDFRALALREEGGSKSKDTFSEMIRLHGSALGNSGVHRNWNRFVRGLHALNALVQKTSCVPPDAVEKAFDDLRQYWHQSLYLRAAGFFLLDQAARNGMLGQIERSFTVAFGEDKVITLGQAL